MCRCVGVGLSLSGINHFYISISFYSPNGDVSHPISYPIHLPNTIFSPFKPNSFAI